MTASVSIAEGIATVVFSRPGHFNSFDVETIRELHATCRATLARADVRVLVLASEGEAFCTGADVKTLAASRDAPAMIRALTGELHPLVELLHRGPKPTVTAIHGAAAGGGFGIAMAGDVRIASEEARFTPAYPRIGLTPDGGLTYFLARYAGLAEAQRILLLNETVSAAHALRLGLVHRVVPAGRLAEEAGRVARTLANWSPESVTGTKALLGHAWDRAIAQQMEKEALTIAHAGAGTGFQEGARAFVEGRAGPPR